MAEKVARLKARNIEHEALKGKVDVKFYGHAGFKIHFLDEDDEHRNIYIDLWLDNKDCPAEDREAFQNNCDLSLVTHAQEAASGSTPQLALQSKRPGEKIVSSSEVGTMFELFKRIPPGMIGKM